MVGFFTSPESLVKKKKNSFRHKGKQWVGAVTDGPRNVKQMSVNLCLFSFGLPGLRRRSFVFVSRRLSIKSLPSKVDPPSPATTTTNPPKKHLLLPTISQRVGADRDHSGGR